jgi:hypothetical protein
VAEVLLRTIEPDRLVQASRDADGIATEYHSRYQAMIRSSPPERPISRQVSSTSRKKDSEEKTEYIGPLRMQMAREETAQLQSDDRIEQREGKAKKLQETGGGSEKV